MACNFRGKLAEGRDLGPGPLPLAQGRHTEVKGLWELTDPPQILLEMTKGIAKRGHRKCLENQEGAIHKAKVPSTLSEDSRGRHNSGRRTPAPLWGLPV